MYETHKCGKTPLALNVLTVKCCCVIFTCTRWHKLMRRLRAITISCLLLCCRIPPQNNQPVFSECFWTPQLHSLFASGPLFPLSVGLRDWLITSFVPEGKRGMSTWLILSLAWWRMEGGGGVFFSPDFLSSPFLDAPQALYTHVLFLTVTNELIFWKALGWSLGKRGVGAFSLPQESSCMPVRWCLFPLPNCFCYFLLYKWDQLCLAQQGDSQHILGMMGSFCTRFEWCGLQQLSYHSSRRGNMRCGGLLPVTDLIYMNAGDWHCVSIIFLSWASYCFPRVSLPRFVCVCTCEMQMLCEIPVHTLSRNNAGLCCQVWTGASPSRPQPCLFFPPIPLRFTAVALAVPHSWEQ